MKQVPSDSHSSNNCSIYRWVCQSLPTQEDQQLCLWTFCIKWWWCFLGLGENMNLWSMAHLHHLLATVAFKSYVCVNLAQEWSKQMVGVIKSVRYHQQDVLEKDVHSLSVTSWHDSEPLLFLSHFHGRVWWANFGHALEFNTLREWWTHRRKGSWIPGGPVG